MKELIKQGYIGNPAQLVTLRRVTVNEGRARGTEIIEVKTALNGAAWRQEITCWDWSRPTASSWDAMTSAKMALCLF